MSKPVTISDLTFQTKGAAKQFFGAIQNRYADGQRFDAEDHSLIRGLLACHPETKDKTGVGVAWFSVETETVSAAPAISSSTAPTSRFPTLVSMRASRAGMKSVIGLNPCVGR